MGRMVRVTAIGCGGLVGLLVLLLVGGLVGMGTLGIQNYRVDGHAMAPTLTNGQYALFRQRIPYERGDIVVFDYPREPSRQLVMRVVGLPGETVEVTGGRVLVDGVELAEPYVMEAARYAMPPQSVPKGHLFVLGDNRNNSADSHVWGPLAIDSVRGVFWLVYWDGTQ